MSASGLLLRPTNEVQSLLDGHRATRRSLIGTDSEYLDVGVTDLRRTTVTGQDHEMGTAGALGDLCRFHECALICGCTIGAITFRNRDPKNSPTDLFVW